MAALTSQERRVLQRVSQKSGLTRSAIAQKETVKSKKGEVDIAMKPADTAETIDHLINIGLLSGPKPTEDTPDPIVTVTQQGKQELAFYRSFQRLRAAIGSLAIALPFVLPIGYIITGGNGILGSISAYYYTDMRNIFVGVLCAIGGALFAYKDAPWQDIWTKLAAIAAVLVAFFPTNQGGLHTVVGTLHTIFAVSLFAALAVTSYFLLTKDDIAKGGYPTAKDRKAKEHRNIIYRVSGAFLIVCALLVLVVSLLPHDTGIWLFWVEALGLFFIGITWVIKGNWLISRIPYLSP
jgi:hypothetical protein